MKFYLLIALLFISFLTYGQTDNNLLAYSDYSLIDTIRKPINVNSDLSDEKENKFGLTFTESLDFLYNDFGEFESILESYNVDKMGSFNPIFVTEIAGNYNRFYFGLSFGYDHEDHNKHDSLDIEFNTTRFGLHLGYNLVDSKRFLVTPKFALKWNRYRLINSTNEDEIPLDQYITERDLDLRFNQLTGFIGVNLSVKFYQFSLEPCDYWTVGIYGGYLFKFHNKPFLSSSKTKLTTNNKIGIQDYNIGIYISYYL